LRSVFSPRHASQDAPVEHIRGKAVPSFEKPKRAEIVLARIRSVFGDQVTEPKAFGTAPLMRVHSPELIEFLSSFWTIWSAENPGADGFPNAWPPPRSTPGRTERIGAKLGRFCIDMSSPILAGTWDAVSASADVALTAQELVANSGGAAFALCRPPGHHAGFDYYGGYCFVNNAAVAAQAFRDQGAARVAVLDIDYHHGNGTQDIFYARADVLTTSIHGDPKVEYPYYSGYTDEIGAGAGAGFNANYPLPWGSAFATYRPALTAAISRIRSFGAEAVVVSLGVDTFEKDPISRFKLKTEDYLEIGRLIAGIGKPTLFVMEGGYAVDDLGINVANVLCGYEDAVK
jgi:acetoin utilization deacetylase AcuC-like enzyme